MNSIFKFVSTVFGLSVSFHLPASAAVFTVTDSDWGTSTTTNSFAWAIEQANANPGADTIDLRLTSGSSIYVDNATPVNATFLSRITGDLKINGNGVTLEGNPKFAGDNGIVYTKTNIGQYFDGKDILVTPALSFAIVGNSATAANLEVKDLSSDGLFGFLKVEANSVASVVNSVFKNSVPYVQNILQDMPVIEVFTDATVNLRNVVIENVARFEELNVDFPFIWKPTISGLGASLNMIDSAIKGRSGSLGAINWSEGVANIVSSILYDESNGGISVDGENAVVNFVNSLYLGQDSAESEVSRFQAWDKGVLNIIASTIQLDSFLLETPSNCSSNSTYGCNGAPLQAFSEGEINLEQSIVSTLNSDISEIANPYSEVLSYLRPGGTPASFVNGNMTADSLSYVQPTPSLNSDVLKILFDQPQLLTGLIPFELANVRPPYQPYQAPPQGAALLPGSPLRSAIADADGANQLINPIDGSVITTDVFGNPRTAFGRRDIGAVQSTQEVPGPLPVLGAGAAFGWARRLRKRVRQHSLENATIPSPRN